MPRVVNLRSVRGAIKTGELVSAKELANRLEVETKTIQTSLRQAMAECCGVRIVRTGTGHWLGIERVDTADGDEWAEPMRADLVDE